MTTLFSLKAQKSAIADGGLEYLLVVDTEEVVETFKLGLPYAIKQESRVKKNKTKGCKNTTTKAVEAIASAPLPKDDLVEEKPTKIVEEKPTKKVRAPRKRVAPKSVLSTDLSKKQKLDVKLQNINIQGGGGGGDGVNEVSESAVTQPPKETVKRQPKQQQQPQPQKKCKLGGDDKNDADVQKKILKLQAELSRLNNLSKGKSDEEDDSLVDPEDNNSSSSTTTTSSETDNDDDNESNLKNFKLKSYYGV